MSSKCFPKHNCKASCHKVFFAGKTFFQFIKNNVIICIYIGVIIIFSIAIFIVLSKVNKNKDNEHRPQYDYSAVIHIKQRPDRTLCKNTHFRKVAGHRRNKCRRPFFPETSLNRPKTKTSLPWPGERRFYHIVI